MSQILTFERYLEESYKNLLLSDPDKEKYKQQVFNMLQKCYAPIGGIHGAGFQNPDDMVKNIPFWKLDVKDGHIRSVAMYKDKQGRKRVAIAIDGTDEGKKSIIRVVTEDYQRAYFEISDRSLSFQTKILGYEHLKKFAKTPEEAARISGDELGKPSEDDPEIKRHPELKQFFYTRKIGSAYHTKIMLGTSGKKIVENA